MKSKNVNPLIEGGEKTNVKKKPPFHKTAPPPPSPNIEEQKNLMFSLRTITGMGLMDCKECLEENSWILEKAMVEADLFYYRRGRRY